MGAWSKMCSDGSEIRGDCGRRSNEPAGAAGESPRDSLVCGEYLELTTSEGRKYSEIYNFRH